MDLCTQCNKCSLICPHAAVAGPERLESIALEQSGQWPVRGVLGPLAFRPLFKTTLLHGRPLIFLYLIMAFHDCQFSTIGFWTIHGPATCLLYVYSLRCGPSCSLSRS